MRRKVLISDWGDRGYSDQSQLTKKISLTKCHDFLQSVKKTRRIIKSQLWTKTVFFVYWDWSEYPLSRIPIIKHFDETFQTEVKIKGGRCPRFFQIKSILIHFKSSEIWVFWQKVYNQTPNLFEEKLEISLRVAEIGRIWSFSVFDIITTKTFDTFQKILDRSTM